MTEMIQAPYYNKNGIVVRTSILKDVYYLSTRLRASDIDEIWASHNAVPHEALNRGFENSILCLTIEDNGDPICMFGVVPLNIISDKATIWMLGSDGIDRIKIRFIRNNRKIINELLDVYSHLSNYVSVDNFKSLQWLRWLGASFDAPVIYGIEGKLFQRFWFERET